MIPCNRFLIFGPHVLVVDLKSFQGSFLMGIMTPKSMGSISGGSHWQVTKK